jgi:hypothetical protein
VRLLPADRNQAGDAGVAWVRTYAPTMTRALASA